MTRSAAGCRSTATGSPRSPPTDGAVDPRRPGSGAQAGVAWQRAHYIKSGGANLARVELRFSPSCHTAWSRVTNLAGGVYVIEQVDRLSGGYANDTDYLSTGQGGYSPQLYVRNGKARAGGLWDYDYTAFTPWIAL